jgi:hypothetical protein
MARSPSPPVSMSNPCVPCPASFLNPTPKSTLMNDFLRSVARIQFTPSDFHFAPSFFPLTVAI